MEYFLARHWCQLPRNIEKIKFGNFRMIRLVGRWSLVVLVVLQRIFFGGSAKNATVSRRVFIYQKDWQLVKHALSGIFSWTFQKVGVFVRNCGSEATSYSDTTPLRTCQVNRHYISNTFLVKSSGHFSEAEICVFFAGGAEAKFKLSAGCISGWEVPKLVQNTWLYNLTTYPWVYGIFHYMNAW